MNFSLVQEKKIWSEAGVIPVSLQGERFGGQIALLYEASRLATFLGIPRVALLLSQDFAWEKSLSLMFGSSSSTNLPIYPKGIKALETFVGHSTMRLMHLPELKGTEVNNERVWSEEVRLDVEHFLKLFPVREGILFATKFSNGNSKLGEFNPNLWSQILASLSDSREILVLGSNPDRSAFAKLKVNFVADYLDIPSQIELAARMSYPLIGDASGFFSAAIWNTRGYLCFKDPSYDETEMLLEHSGYNRLKVASAGQYLWRQKPSLQLICSFIEEYECGIAK